MAFGLVLNAIGLYLFWLLGRDATFASLMPGFVLFGAGSGLMNVPLTNAVLSSMPAERSGMASALLNNSREVAGLLGITVIGAVLRSRQGVALAHGVGPASAFLDGYHAGLALTIVLVAAGVVISYLALRRLPAPAASPVLVPARDRAAGQGGPAAGPELAGPGHSPRLTRRAASACPPGPAWAVSIHQVAPAAV